MGRIKDYFFRWIEKTFFPKYHNAIAKAVVYFGLGLLAGKPLLFLIFEAITAKVLNFTITGNDSGYGFGLVIVGLIYHLIFQWLLHLKEALDQSMSKQKDSQNLKTTTDKKKFDKKVFQSNEALAGENWIEFLVEDMSNSARCKYDNLDKIDAFCLDASKSKYIFFDQNIEQKRQAFISSVNVLKGFMDVSFDGFDGMKRTFNYAQLQRPEHNPYGERPETKGLDYMGLRNKLIGLLEQVQSSYLEYREEVRKRLII